MAKKPTEKWLLYRYEKSAAHLMCSAFLLILFFFQLFFVSFIQIFFLLLCSLLNNNNNNNYGNQTERRAKKKMCRDFLYRLHLWHLPVKEWKKAGKHAHIPHLTRLKLEIVINNNQATSLSPHWAVIAYRWKYNEHLIYVRQREMEMVMVVFGLGNTIRTVRMENNCIPSKVNFRLNFISFWFIFIHYALGGGALPQAKIALPSSTYAIMKYIRLRLHCFISWCSMSAFLSLIQTTQFHIFSLEIKFGPILTFFFP